MNQKSAKGLWILMVSTGSSMISFNFYPWSSISCKFMNGLSSKTLSKAKETKMSTKHLFKLGLMIKIKRSSEKKENLSMVS